MRSQELLSALEIPYADCYTQADIDRKAQSLIQVFRVWQAGTFAPPAAPIKDIFNPELNMQIMAVNLTYRAAVSAGNVEAAHAAHANFNALGHGALTGPKSDLDILRNGYNPAAELAKYLIDLKNKGERVALFDDPVESTQAKIDAYNVKVDPLPAPAMSMPAPPWDTTPIGSVIQAPDGTKWRKENSIFGAMYYRV